MSIRIICMYVAVIGLCAYAWKDWFKSLCGLIILMAGLQHEDMPRTLFGIPGMNAWNLLFGVILLAWIVRRCRERLHWDMPRHVSVMVLLYVAVIVVGVLRAILDRGQYQEYPVSSLIMDELISTVKWILPAILLYDGCRTRRRVVFALVSLLTMYLLIAIQVTRHIPPESALGGAGAGIEHTRLKVGRAIGYHCTDLSVMLAGACWGTVALIPLACKKSFKVTLGTAACMFAYCMALTGGRGGYVAWGATGLTLCLVKWRKHLLLAPVVVILLPIVFPGAVARMLTGFGHTSVDGQETVDKEQLGSGRLLIWPYVVAEVGKSPWIGYGRLAMKRTGLFDRIETEYPGTGAPHPHNAYLETLFDNGILGSLPIVIFWGMVLIYSGALFRSSNRLYSAVGGLSFAGTLSSLFAGITGQHFYPQEHTLPLWAAFFLSLRVYVEESRARVGAMGTEFWRTQPISVEAREATEPVTA
jgi:O-antigen ligase